MPPHTPSKKCKGPHTRVTSGSCTLRIAADSLCRIRIKYATILFPYLEPFFDCVLVCRVAVWCTRKQRLEDGRSSSHTYVPTGHYSRGARSLASCDLARAHSLRQQPEPSPLVFCLSRVFITLDLPPLHREARRASKRASERAFSCSAKDGSFEFWPHRAPSAYSLARSAVCTRTHAPSRKREPAAPHSPQPATARASIPSQASKPALVGHAPKPSTRNHTREKHPLSPSWTPARRSRRCPCFTPS